MPNNDKKVSLLNLQKEYLQKTLTQLDEMISLSADIAHIDDEEIFNQYVEQIQKMEKDADSNYKIACDIENVIQKQDNLQST